MADYIPLDIINILKSRSKFTNFPDNIMFEKDINETVGFQNGFKPYTDFRTCGVFGAITLINFFERVDLIFEKDNMENKFLKNIFNIS